MSRGQLAGTRERAAELWNRRAASIAERAEVERLTDELEKCAEDAERWRYTLAHGFPVRGQNGEWYVVDARDFKGFPTPTKAIDAARSKP
jgi:hypothetical protein